MRPGAAAGEPPQGLVAGAAAVTSIQLRSATVPPLPLASITTVSTCRPAGSETPVFVNVCQVFQPPVSGSAIAPVPLAPSTATCTVPPVPFEATRKPSE